MWYQFFRYETELPLSIQARVAMLRMLHVFEHEMKAGCLAVSMQVLAKKLHLNQSTQGKLFDELAKAGVIEFSHSALTGRKGRPVRMLKLTNIATEFFLKPTEIKSCFIEAMEQLKLHEPSSIAAGAFQNDLKLSKGESLLLGTLLAHADEFGRVEKLTQKKMGMLTGLKAPTITQYLKKLRQNDFIRQVIRGFNGKGVFGRKTSVYFLTLDLVRSPYYQSYYRFSFFFDSDYAYKSYILSEANLVRLGIESEIAKGFAESLRPLERQTQYGRFKQIVDFWLASTASKLLELNTHQLDAILAGSSSDSIAKQRLQLVKELVDEHYPSLCQIIHYPAKTNWPAADLLRQALDPDEWLLKLRSKNHDNPATTTLRVAFFLRALFMALEVKAKIKTWLKPSDKVFLVPELSRVGDLAMVSFHSSCQLVDLYFPAPPNELMIKSSDLRYRTSSDLYYQCDDLFGIPESWIDSPI